MVGLTSDGSQKTKSDIAKDFAFGSYGHERHQKGEVSTGVTILEPSKPKQARAPKHSDLREENETVGEANQRLKVVSRRNINALLEWRPGSAKDIGVESRWLSRLRKEGLSYVTKANQENIERIVAYFGLNDYLDLWRENLLETLGIPGPSDKLLRGLIQSRYWKHADKLVQILETGDYDYLAQLIDGIWNLEVTRTVKQSEAYRSPPTKRKKRRRKMSEP